MWVSDHKKFKQESDGASNQAKALCWVKSTLKGDYAEHVFYHELTHLLLWHMNSKLTHNEAFVDGFAGLLHQFIKTRKQ